MKQAQGVYLHLQVSIIKLVSEVSVHSISVYMVAPQQFWYL